VERAGVQVQLVRGGVGRHTRQFRDRRAVLRLDKPALVIVGTEDRITVPGIARATARKLAGPVDYHELPGVGHWLFWGAIELKVGQLIADWLGQFDS
jgi:pimeloyl-ACP methyl ester carboxylesterase